MFLTMRSLALLSLALNILSFSPRFQGKWAVTAHPTHEAKDTHGAVASEAKECSQIGIELLKKGGNAADALVGTVFCIGVIGMYHSGCASNSFHAFYI